MITADTSTPAARRRPARSRAASPTGPRTTSMSARASGLVRELGRKIFPDHWSFMLGEVALYSFVVILLSGTFLTFFFQPSMAVVTYDGSYAPLKGIQMSAAMSSTLNISFDIRGGLLLRQVHHWAALLFVASIGLHMLRIFFTGAFRKPRELNWVIGFMLFVLALAEGFTGYSLPDDLLSGNGLRIIDGMVKGIPSSAPGSPSFAVRRRVPGHGHRRTPLQPAHPAAARRRARRASRALLIVNKHTQFAAPGRTEGNVVGVPIMPGVRGQGRRVLLHHLRRDHAHRAFVTINPIWTYGPYDPSPVSAGTQPDWYIGFADGALRLIPLHGCPGGVPMRSRTCTPVSMNIFVPILVLGLFLVVVVAVPVLRGVVDGRQARAPHRRPAPEHADPHRHRRGRRHLLRRPVGRREL